MATNWADNYNVLYQSELPIDDNKVWKFALEEHKVKGTLQLNVRLFKQTPNYSGPTKSGFIYPITSLNELNQFQSALNNYFENIKSKF